jgi:toxin-antitoxin system PIN domain toxin
LSYSVDVNILLYASDRQSPFHARAAEFLAECASNAEPFCLTWPTLMGYLRIVTHPSIFKEPLSLEEAVSNVEALLGLPQVRILAEGREFWPIYREVTKQAAVRGNLVPDAHIAALLLQHGVRTLYTNDSDFEDFDFLDLCNPFVPEGDR